MKKTIALVTGGFSGESVISYKSAATIQKNLDTEKFNVFLIDINPQGWFHNLVDGRKVSVDKNDFSLPLDNRRVRFDAVFIGMHGTPGEDGKLQGYFDTLGIPYTSCDAATSAITFNKRYTVAVARMAGIAVANSVHIFRHSQETGVIAAKQLNYPVFVKPNNGGSSIGMSKVHQPSDESAPLVPGAGQALLQLGLVKFVVARRLRLVHRSASAVPSFERLQIGQKCAEILRLQGLGWHVNARFDAVRIDDPTAKRSFGIRGRTGAYGCATFQVRQIRCVIAEGSVARAADGVA